MIFEVKNPKISKTEHYFFIFFWFSIPKYHKKNLQWGINMVYELYGWVLGESRGQTSQKCKKNMKTMKKIKIDFEAINQYKIILKP